MKQGTGANATVTVTVMDTVSCSPGSAQPLGQTAKEVQVSTLAKMTMWQSLILVTSLSQLITSLSQLIQGKTVTSWLLVPLWCDLGCSSQTVMVIKAAAKTRL